MDKLQEINTYITEMKIKKTLFGGYDREDVYVKIGNIVEMFQKNLEEIQKKEEELVDSYEKRLHASDLLVAELNKKIGSLTAEQKGAVQEKERLKEAYKDYCSNILQQYSDSLRTLSAEFTQILENVTNLQKNIIDTDIFERLDTELEVEKTPELPANDEAAIEDIEEAQHEIME